ncbi:hypothetical protein B566_EDAN017088 [Ephemera danica]|nr:hypothetical protein B566_EDAN017088 [Ephemera danica]
MYSQQHTVPMTGEGGDNSGTGWTCTQPITSQKKQGFLQRLSDRPFSLKAVSKPITAVEEGLPKEGPQLRNWGSYENILEESAALQRSPSLPLLSTKPVTSSQLLRGSHFPCHTPKQTPGSLHGNSETTPQKQMPHQCPLSAKITQFAQDLHSKVDQTPQQHTQSQHFNRTMSAQRGPLQSITPKQLYLSDMQQQKSTLKVEKENCMPTQDQMLNPILEEILSPWKQELLQEMKSDSPILPTASKPQRSTSPLGVMRSLFNETPLKQNVQVINHRDYTEVSGSLWKLA